MILVLTHGLFLHVSVNRYEQISCSEGSGTSRTESFQVSCHEGSHIAIALGWWAHAIFRISAHSPPLLAFDLSKSDRYCD